MDEAKAAAALARVIDEVNRYRPGRIIVVDPRLGRRSGAANSIREMAVTRISLHSLVRAVSRLLIAAAVKMAQRQRMVGRKVPGIEWAEPDPAFGPFDCALGLATPTQNSAAAKVSEGG